MTENVKIAKQHIFISVGDASGDEYASLMIKHLKRMNPELNIVGFGGPLMVSAGATLLRMTTQKSSIGFLEPLKHIPSYLKDLKIAKKYFHAQPNCWVLAIDHQGFNVKLLEAAKKLGLKTAYYICPQEWQWGNEKNGKKVLQCVDHFFCIFPEAANFYQKLGGNVSYVGHPIFDTLPKLDFHCKKDSILFLPGSRAQEINLMAPLMAKCAKMLSTKYPHYTLKVSIQNPIYKPLIQKYFENINIEFFDQLTPSIFNEAAACLSCSGTVTLKLALLGIPTIAVYKFHPFSYLIAKLILGKKLKKIPFFALPNLLLKEEIIPEFLQKKASPEKCVLALDKLLKNKVHSSQTKQNQLRLIQLLSPQNSCEKTAELINQEITNEYSRHC